MRARRYAYMSCLCIAFLCAGITGKTIKLGSLAPNGSPWDKALRKMAAEWAVISNNKIQLKIYSGGIAGGEDDMIRKMRIGQLQAAGLTGIGMSRISQGILAMQFPLLMRNDKELTYVMEKMSPRFNEALEKKGFKTLIWTKVGWTHFFSKDPVTTPDDLKTHKLFVYAGDSDGTQAWKAAGFNPVPLSPTELMNSLNSGMVNAFSTTPLTAAAYQWFGLAKNMSGMKWAPLIGGIVISTKTWNSIPQDMRDKLMAAADKIGDEIQEEIDGADAEAIEIMKKHGLKVHPMPQDARAQWKAQAQKGFDMVIGKSFDRASYDAIVKHLEEFRNANGN
jgi:TRAP-type transport system periplasmic protein